MARAFRTSAETVEWMLKARDEPPGEFEWMRHSGVMVRMIVLPDGTIRTWEQQWVELESVKADSFAAGCEAVENLCHGEMMP